uniref:Uncharacterized protein n=1 Tax=Coccolithus braarudii TaxID=221442 RepID=A0A7S0Q764_9EUKA|mmetsp:Transcript_7325/g.16075  ORF Transcript_7325/g.16075 Transcript_7325/m.16075 type:complete len:350 (+) Transcript_7325:80-1129(+)
MAELQNDACDTTCTGTYKLYNTKEEMVLTGEDDSKVWARAASRIKKLVPPAALAGKGTFITPMRARGKRNGNLGLWDLEIVAPDDATLTTFIGLITAGGEWRICKPWTKFNSAGAISILVPDEERIGPLVYALVALGKAAHVGYSNQVPMAFGFGKAALIVSVSAQQLVERMPTREAVDEDVVTIGLNNTEGTLRAEVHDRVLADAGTADVAILGELERIDTLPGSTFIRWMFETFGVAENSLGLWSLRDDYTEGAFVVRFPELSKTRAIRDGFAAQCKQEEWYTPTPGDHKGKFGAGHPPKLLFAKGPTALRIVAKKFARWQFARALWPIRACDRQLRVRTAHSRRLR